MDLDKDEVRIRLVSLQISPKDFVEFIKGNYSVIKDKKFEGGRF